MLRSKHTKLMTRVSVSVKFTQIKKLNFIAKLMQFLFAPTALLKGTWAMTLFNLVLFS